MSHKMSSIFGLLAGCTSIITYVLYIGQVIKGKSTPNPATWGIWLLVGIINIFTFLSLVDNSRQQISLLIVGTVSIFIIFLFSLRKGKISKISTIELICFILAIIIGAYRQFTSNNRLSNLILQLVYVISFIPTINGIIKHKTKEYPLAWFAASIAYIFATISLLSVPLTDRVAYAHPIIIGIIGNMGVAILILKKKSRTTSLVVEDKQNSTHG